ncbi:hypothetical protein BH09MYX1_BH09MYX1_18560 [soil metagenome]
MRKRASLSLTVVACVIACGGAAKPPTSSDPTTTPSATTSASTDAPAGSSTATEATSAAVAQATPSATAAVPSADPCADLSAPFEAKVRPDVKKCFFDAMAKRPDLDGHVHITVPIDTKGKAGNILVANDKILGKDTVACMTNAVKAGAFDGAACAGKSVVMNMAFGSAARN